MARWENEGLEGLDLPEPDNKVSTYFGLGAEESSPNNAFVKVVDNNGFKTHYIKILMFFRSNSISIFCK